MGTILPRQGTAYHVPWSLVRDNQLRTVLEDSLGALHGRGVLAGGRVVHTTGFSGAVPADTVVFADGLRLPLSEPVMFTAAEPNSTVYLWGRVARTPATQSNRMAEDTYALEIIHSLTDAPPSADHFPLAVLTTDGSGITAIDNEPPGKYLRALTSPLVVQRDTIAAGETQFIPGGHQVALFDSVTIAGVLVLAGKLRITV